MSSVLVIFTVMYLICVAQSNKPILLQERAVINFFDPAYVKNPQAFTGRSKRGDSYKTNITVIILHPWGNNVTVTVIYANQRTGVDQLIKVRCCDAYKQPWIKEFIYQYILQDKKKACPFPAGTYNITNVELPPKNYPLPVFKGDSQVYFLFELTEKKHVMLKLSMRIKA